MSLTNPKGYGIPEAQASAIHQIVLDILRQDPTILQKKLATSADVAAALSNETGTGAVVLGTGPVIDNPQVSVLRLRNATTAAVVGNAVLVAGTVTITCTQCTAASYLVLQRKITGGTIGDLTYTVGAGSFTITSASNIDTSTITWVLMNGY